MQNGEGVEKLSIQLAEKLYREHGLISVCNDGVFVDFEIEKEKTETAATVNGQ